MVAFAIIASISTTELFGVLVVPVQAQTAPLISFVIAVTCADPTVCGLNCNPGSFEYAQDSVCVSRQTGATTTTAASQPQIAALLNRSTPADSAWTQQMISLSPYIVTTVSRRYTCNYALGTVVVQSFGGFDCDPINVTSTVTYPNNTCTGSKFVTCVWLSTSVDATNGTSNTTSTAAANVTSAAPPVAASTTLPQVVKTQQCGCDPLTSVCSAATVARFVENTCQPMSLQPIYVRRQIVPAVYSVSCQSSVQMCITLNYYGSSTDHTCNAFVTQGANMCGGCIESGWASPGVGSYKRVDCNITDNSLVLVSGCDSSCTSCNGRTDLYVMGDCVYYPDGNVQLVAMYPCATATRLLTTVANNCTQFGDQAITVAQEKCSYGVISSCDTRPVVSNWFTSIMQMDTNGNYNCGGNYTAVYSAAVAGCSASCFGASGVCYPFTRLICQSFQTTCASFVRYANDVKCAYASRTSQFSYGCNTCTNLDLLGRTSTNNFLLVTCDPDAGPRVWADCDPACGFCATFLSTPGTCVANAIGGLAFAGFSNCNVIQRQVFNAAGCASAALVSSEYVNQGMCQSGSRVACVLDAPAVALRTNLTRQRAASSPLGARCLSVAAGLLMLCAAVLLLCGVL